LAGNGKGWLEVQEVAEVGRKWQNVSIRTGSGRNGMKRIKVAYCRVELRYSLSGRKFRKLQNGKKLFEVA